MKRFLILLACCVAPVLFADDGSRVSVQLDDLWRPPARASALARAVVVKETAIDLANVAVEVAVTSTRAVTVRSDAERSDPQWSCTASGAQRIRCTLPLLLANARTSPALYIEVTPANVGRLEVTAQAEWTVNGTPHTSAPAVRRATFPRELTVTNTADSGEGSLRAAIEQANESCAADGLPCLIAFRIAEPMPHNGIRAIQLLAPLPTITAPDIAIQGDAAEPMRDVVLDGSRLSSGNGLLVAGEGPWSITRLSIVGFPGDGIVVRRRGQATAAGHVVYCTIGVSAAGVARPNGGRGISFEAPTSHVTVDATAISANGRSGISIAGASQILIRGVLIGPYRFATQPVEGNGASGIAILPGSRDISITQSYVSRNGHFGIAIAPGVPNVRISNSVVLANGGLDIDHGIDGFSGYFAGEDASATNLPAPLITSVTWDPVSKQTTVTGTFDAPDDRAWELTLVAERPFPFNVWPEASLPTRVFTGRSFSFSMPFYFDESLRAYVNSAQPSQWSTSELSERAGIPRGRRRSVR